MTVLSVFLQEDTSTGITGQESSVLPIVKQLLAWQKTGFIDTGFIDEEAPDCLNLMYHFPD